MGLSIPRVVRRVPDPVDFHRYVSGDPTVSVTGTELPLIGGGWSVDVPSLDRVARAVSVATRTPMDRLGADRVSRRVLLRAMRTLCDANLVQIGRYAGLAATTVGRTPTGYSDEVTLVERILGDVRFPALTSIDLRRTPGWERYSRCR